ncbi:MAG: primosomal protein [Gammaproteobacteria bacterium]|nr:primosomal protein [Gammaproteobacteria bacterium]
MLIKDSILDRKVVRVAVPGPFMNGLDYLSCEPSTSLLGKRVWVPLGKRKLVGIVIAENVEPEFDLNKLKAVLSVIDQLPLFDSKLMQLLTRVSEYYQAPIGEVFCTAMPAQLCDGDALVSQQRYWQLTAQDINLNDFKRAAKQAAALNLLKKFPKALEQAAFSDLDITNSVLKNLEQKGLVQSFLAAPEDIKLDLNFSQPKLSLNKEQQQVLDACLKFHNQFCVQLIEGVTGSGKTEIYLQLIDEALKTGKQALVLVPEIGLTPQTVERFQARFGQAVITLHSKLTETEKRQHWYLAKEGLAKIVIGTRSAVFTPMPDLGIIVIDEEHDLSFKQQNGVRYSARDIGVMRAKLENIPIVLGSATPCLESLYNAQKGRYQHYCLPNRAGASTSPTYHLIDMRQQPMQAGLSRPLFQAVKQHLSQNSQVLLFLNRRGYAPVLMCHACGWTAQCKNCDAYFTLHQQPLHLCCHHCGSSQKVFKACPQCEQAENLIHVGMGTEQLETALNKLFPEHKVLRLDRDSTRHKGSLDQILKSVHQREADIIVGTQMLAKGHHFEGVTMVGIIDMDNGLFSSDFRSIERAGQLLVQVAGRAGRAEQQGEVYIQTHQPEHPLLLTLLKKGYREFTQDLLIERKQADWPPFSYLALLRAEALDSRQVFQFLNQIKNFMQNTETPDIQLLGPAPALMQKKARYFRGQLLLQSKDRRNLQAALRMLQAYLKEMEKHKVKWAIDVDPLEMA